MKPRLQVCQICCDKSIIEIYGVEIKKLKGKRPVGNFAFLMNQRLGNGYCCKLDPSGNSDPSVVPEWCKYKTELAVCQ